MLVTDTGLLCHLLGLDAERLLAEPDRLGPVLDPQYRDDSLTRAAERYQMELFRPVDPYSQHITLPLSSSAATPRAGEARTQAARAAAVRCKSAGGTAPC